MHYKTLGIITLILALFMSGCALEPMPDVSTPEVSTPAPTSYQTITAEEAYTMMKESDDFILLDVRTMEEYLEAHIKGAVLLPNESIDETTAKEVLPQKDAQIFLYCRTGRRSAEAAGKLFSLGYTNVYDFGGIVDWPYDVVK
ncbi:MAG TPA: rhodanese-like domain-containing protein [Clostridia bacterium]|nr:rhodanese-like domain-containing protein [Clostridia bacterium]